MNASSLAQLFAQNIIEDPCDGDDNVLTALIDISSELASELAYAFPELKDYGVEHQDYFFKQETESNSKKP